MVQPKLEEGELEKAAELQKGRSAVAIVATRCFRTAAKIGWLSLWVAAVASPQEEPWNGVCDTIFAVIHYFLYSMRDYIVIYKGSKRYIARVCRQFLFEIFFLSLSAKAKEDSFLLGADPTSARHVSLWPGQVRLISLELLCSSWRRGIPVWRWGNGAILFFFSRSFDVGFFSALGNLKLFTFFCALHLRNTNAVWLWSWVINDKI